jgi:hypothetical protein
MATMERSGTLADVAVEWAAIEAEIEGSMLLTSFAQTVAAAGDMVSHLWPGGRAVAVINLQAGARPGP